ncbi:hypothetical protein E2C01_071443 [Portunus trituberculatus]|uniref:Uncharacterized protein n=1 Tax=Portunus trituberculatus TaxID=210409 RepID=A0A5B7I4Y9_PORTR|nr:hypothetical protein [Portunus trituberculatus]
MGDHEDGRTQEAGQGSEWLTLTHPSLRELDRVQNGTETKTSAGSESIAVQATITTTTTTISAIIYHHHNASSSKTTTTIIPPLPLTSATIPGTIFQELAGSQDFLWSWREVGGTGMRGTQLRNPRSPLPPHCSRSFT